MGAYTYILDVTCDGGGENGTWELKAGAWVWALPKVAE